MKKKVKKIKINELENQKTNNEDSFDKFFGKTIGSEAPM